MAIALTSGWAAGIRKALSLVTDRGTYFLPVVGLTFMAGVVTYLFVWLVDPYDLRPGGVKLALAEHPYADDIVPRLISAASHDGTDIAVIGGSTSMGFTPEMLRETFRELTRPVNLSFVAQTPAHLKTTFDYLGKSSTLKRVILSLDFTLLSSPDWVWDQPSMRYYKGNWHNPVPEFAIDSIPLAFDVLRTGILDQKSWRRRRPERPDFMFYALTVANNPEALAKLAKAADSSRDWVTGMPDIACDSIRTLHEVVIPAVETLTKRGVAVDLFFPPYSLAVYSDWTLNFPDGYFFSGNGAVYAKLTGLKRCVIEATDGMNNVRVHAFDTNTEITGDMSRYLDSSHIYDMKTYQELLISIASGSAVLSKSRWPQFEADLKKAIHEFRP